MRYMYKYPRTSWDVVGDQVNRGKRRYFRSLERARVWIEGAMRPGYTREPWMQLIQISDEGMSVIAEYDGHAWCGALEAAGFVSRRVA